MFRKKENGQAIVILAIGLIVLLAFAALAIDAGAVYTARREAQNAVDAAVLAGTRQVVLECARQGLNPGPNESNIRTKTEDMATANNVDGAIQVFYTDDSGTRLSDNEVGTLGAVPCGCGAGAARGLEVIVEKAAPSFFAGIIGQTGIQVKATARARYAPVANVSGGLYPVAVHKDEVAAGNMRTNKERGNFGWLTWDGSPSAQVLEVSMTKPGNSQNYVNPDDPSDNSIDIGDWVQGSPGQSNKLLKTLDWWIASGEPMPVPVYDDTRGGGSHYDYNVWGFAAFVITGYRSQGNEQYIQGYFTEWVTNGDWAAGVTCDQEGGLYSVKLTP